jgi:hypothetical protein
LDKFAKIHFDGDFSRMLHNSNSRRHFAAPQKDGVSATALPAQDLGCSLQPLLPILPGNTATFPH